MANPTKVTANITQAQLGHTQKFALAVAAEDGRILTGWRNVNVNQTTYADGVVTVPIPNDLFEADGMPDGNTRIALRADNAGGEGGVALSAVVSVTWEVPALSNVVAS